MTGFGTSEQAMAQGAAKVDDAANQIQGVLGKLQSEVDTMMGGWRGDASKSFLQVHEAFGQQANKINTALRNMHESLVSTRNTYGTNESDQASAFGGMVNQING